MPINLIGVIVISKHKTRLSRPSHLEIFNIPIFLINDSRAYDLPTQTKDGYIPLVVLVELHDGDFVIFWRHLNVPVN